MYSEACLKGQHLARVGDEDLHENGLVTIYCAYCNAHDDLTLEEFRKLRLSAPGRYILFTL